MGLRQKEEKGKCIFEFMGSKSAPIGVCSLCFMKPFVFVTVELNVY